jgi:hypothetical protein
MKAKIRSLQLIVIILAVSLAAVLVLLGTASTMASAPQAADKPLAGPLPTMVNYQGTLREDGGLYEGTGYFKFAIMDNASGNGTTNYWAHDGTASGEPTTYVTLTVTNGLFNVMLGDTSIMSMTEVISESVFAETNTYLRVWFSDSPSGFQALEPNQQFASVAYALRCTYAESATETDPVFTASAAYGITTGDINNWDLAYNTYDNSRDGWTDSGPSDVYVPSRNVGIDVTNPQTLLHVRDNTGLPLAQLLLERGGPGDSYIEYLLGPAGTSFSTGYDDADKNFKTTNQPNLTGGVGSVQGDGITMMQAYPSGILDFNNQSRARASLNHVQTINPSLWTPIEFDDDFTLTGGYDQHGEFTPWPVSPVGVFRPTIEGYYQIHARTVFTMTPEVQPIVGGYVSIAIFVTDATGITTMYAQGNNLQMIIPLPPPNEPPWVFLEMNNAPNVSDVIYLRPGDVVDIRVWQNFSGLPVPLGMGPSQTYVAIHKDS